MAYQHLRGDPVAWKAYEEGIHAWDVTLTDGLENEDPYYAETELEGILGEDSEKG